ncbi:hypothetical protein GQ54DRAFT_301010 [Martensiomyces pterosporus]|nr:hypothetical protein GQ54DRAFT_301010 [Martensiomyces pterosporus]
MSDFSPIGKMRYHIVGTINNTGVEKHTNTFMGLLYGSIIAFTGLLFSWVFLCFANTQIAYYSQHIRFYPLLRSPSQQY